MMDSGAEQMYTVSQKTLTLLFLNNSVKNELILIIFGTLNPEET